MRNLIATSAVLLLLLWSGCSKDDDNDEIKAAFSWNLSATPGEVIFKNQSSNADAYEWNFGDFASSTANSPTHVYDENGQFIVTLKAFGEGSASVQDTVIVDNIP